MQFFSDKRGNHYPVADIERIDGGQCWGPAEDHRPPKVFLRGDSYEGVPVFDYIYRELINSPFAVIKAEPGFECLTYWPQDEDVSYAFIERQPVLAWKVTIGEGVVPVVLDDESIGTDMIWAILEPNGRVRKLGDCEYENFEAWKTEETRRLEHQRQKEAEAKAARAQSQQSE